MFASFYEYVFVLELVLELFSRVHARRVNDENFALNYQEQERD